MTDVQIFGRFVPGADQTIGRSCYIDVELAGQALPVEIDGFAITVTFPPHVQGEAPAAGYGGYRGTPEQQSSLMLMEFAAFCVVDVDLEDEDSSAEILTRAGTALREAASRIADGIRTVFPWSGFPGDTPEVLELRATDMSTGTEIPIAVSSHPGANPQSVIIVNNLSFGLSDAKECLDGGVSLGDYLLSHAYYFAFRAPQTRSAIAVLLAAVALEAKTKEVLLANITPEARPLLEVVLKRPRIYQEPATDLLNHVAEVVLGRSLRTDDRELWKEVENLFQLRNTVAHRGNAPTVDEAKALVLASRRAIHWLKTGTTDPDSNEPSGFRRLG